MQFLQLGAVLAAAAGLCSALPSSHVLHEKRDAIHARWTRMDRVKPETILPMRIGLTQGNLETAHEHLMDVSHPASPNYGKHWSPEKIAEHFRPSDAAVAAVRQWIEEAGIAAHRVTQSDNKGWLAFQATAAEAESLLHTTFHAHEDTITGHVQPACDAYHVPKHVQDHIDYITPGVRLLAPNYPASNRRDANGQLTHKRGWPTGGKPWPNWPHQPPRDPPYRPMPPDPADLSMCDVVLSPACIAALYHIPPTDHHRKPNPRNSLGIYESELQFVVQEDLDLFFSNFSRYIPNGTHPIAKNIDGGVTFSKNLSESGGESMLDVDLAYPIVWPQTITIFNEDDLLYQAEPNQTYTFGFNDLLDAIDGSYCTYTAFGETGNDPALDPHYPDTRPGGYNGPLQCGIYKPTTVLSVSYGGQEANLPVPYQRRQCNEWLKLGLQGTSVFFASGDSGVGDYPAPYGFSGTTGCIGPQHNIFSPTWPNGCPYLTNVGATKVYPGRTVFEPESAVFDPADPPLHHTNYSSGGGFSNVYPVPDYQKKAVATYFARHNPPYPSYSHITNDTATIGFDKSVYGNGLYNRIGRGIPDVAANGDNAAVYVGGKFHTEGGTSQSTPIFASVVNRLNEERLNIGKSPIGFINPVLYENPWVLNDITNGSNPDCGTSGFSAVPGWDPVTGLGTPNYPKMRELFLRLP